MRHTTAFVKGRGQLPIYEAHKVCHLKKNDQGDATTSNSEHKWSNCLGSNAPTAFIPSHPPPLYTHLYLPPFPTQSIDTPFPSLLLFLSRFYSTLLSAGHNSQKENRHSSAFSIGSSVFQENKRADKLCEVISPGTNQHRSPAWCPPSPHPSWPLTLNTLSLSSFSCSVRVWLANTKSGQIPFIKCKDSINLT